MARVVFTNSADADSGKIYADLHRTAGKSTVQKYRALFSRL
jgi:hypothetical protein